MIDGRQLFHRPIEQVRWNSHNSNERHGASLSGMEKLYRRKTEEVDYWRKRAGWFDDDVKMMEYNNGVYDTFYQMDDDGRASMFGGVSGGANDFKALAIKVAAVVICLILCILMCRVITRRLGDSKKDRKKKKSSGSSRSRSKSRSRSRSRARKSGTDYDLLDEEEKGSKRSGSGRSSRSKSRSRRSRSRSRARSQSRSRREKSSAPPAEPILV